MIQKAWVPSLYNTECDQCYSSVKLSWVVAAVIVQGKNDILENILLFPK